MRSGSITLGLLIGFTLGGLAVGGGVSWFLTGKARDAQARQAAQAHQQEQEALQARVEALGADLATCEARVTAESLTAAATGTTDALGAALAPGLAEVQARAALVSSLTLDRYVEAIIATGSDRMIATDAMMARCMAANTTGDSSRAGCATVVVKQWEAAVQAQAACPSPVLDLGAVGVGVGL